MVGSRHCIMIQSSAFDWAVMFGTAGLTAVLILLLRPLLQRYALALPNARSSHREPTPQGAGIAVIGATIAAVAGAALLVPDLLQDSLKLAVVFACTIGLAAVGVTDDIRPLEALPRLLLQAVAVAIVIAALPAELRIVWQMPWWLERTLMLIGGVWFVNLVNFMDGIDWMTVAEVVPVAAALSLFGFMGALPESATLVAIALCGAVIGFAPFNRPVARLFLGDVGSLPIGLLLGWLLILLAGNGYLTAAILLPLYYLADATVTLMRRVVKGERITQAHRSHFYQRAMGNGFNAYQVVGSVFATNILLFGLATITLLQTSIAIHALMLTSGSALVGALLFRFNRTSR
jgi:UDP-N-acetylmuramyl pentapeptide phosphotransferase/UDP-N-acetylglucosamine-1-phosphate transferase